MELNFEDLQKYLDEELTQELKVDYEKEISESKVLQKKLSLIKEIDIAIQDEDAIEMRAKFEAIHKKHNKNSFKGIKHLNAKKYWAVAATIVLLMGIGTLLWVNTSHEKALSGDELYSMYYEDINAYNYVRSYNSGEPNLASQGYNYYENKDFVNAVECFKNSLNENPQDYSVRLYLGLAYMETEDFNEAISEFDFILNNKPNLFSDNAEWLLGLCYLKTNDNENAVKQFELVASNQNSVYSQKAVEILKKL